jgi:hypothetical protein
MLGDGKCTSLSHCTLKQASVWEIKTTGILPTLVPRLSSTAE